MLRETSKGYSLIELAIAVLIIGIVATIAIPGYWGVMYEAQVVTAIADIKQIANEITVFRITNRRLPASLQEIGMDGKLDPWGRPYRYLRIAGSPKMGNGQVRKDKNLVPLNSDYDLYSVGRDGASISPLTAAESHDDIVRASNGGFVGLATNY